MITMNDGKKKGQPKHQNKKAFKVVFQPHVDKIHQKVSLDGLCKRCVQQMQWKVQFNKYKKMTQPGKCSFCLQKTVFRSYMRACPPCTEDRKVCPKCLSQDFQKPENIPQNAKKLQQRQKQTELQMMQITKKLKERSRRTIKRGLQKGLISWSSEQKYFIDENGQKVTGLHFRRQGLEGEDEQKIDQLDQFGDQDVDDLDDI